MRGISSKAIDLIEPALSESGAEGVGRVFFGALQDLGVKAIYARSYRRATSGAGEEEQVYSRLSPPGWESFYAEKQFQNVNYLPRELRRRADPFQWSEIVLTDPAERGLARALVDNGFPDGLAVPCHGPGGYLGVVSLAFERLNEIAPADRAAVQFASLVLHDRMRKLSNPEKAERPKLTRRERDCLAFIAQGKSDWDISVILGVSHTTIISHVQNAKRKLGATTRAQAIAQCFIQGVL
jgi:LuxR family transcriptional regulator, quorum-sensing system regulator BjaR1